MYKVSSKNFDFDFDRPNATGSVKYWVFGKFVFHFIVYFVIELSRIDQDDQSALVFSFGCHY